MLFAFMFLALGWSLFFASLGIVPVVLSSSCWIGIVECNNRCKLFHVNIKKRYSDPL